MEVNDFSFNIKEDKNKSFNSKFKSFEIQSNFLIKLTTIYIIMTKFHRVQSARVPFKKLQLY